MEASNGDLAPKRRTHWKNHQRIDADTQKSTWPRSYWERRENWEFTEQHGAEDEGELRHFPPIASSAGNPCVKMFFLAKLEWTLHRAGAVEEEEEGRWLRGTRVVRWWLKRALWLKWRLWLD